MRNIMRTIPAIALLVLAAACSAPTDPVSDDAVLGNSDGISQNDDGQSQKQQGRGQDKATEALQN